MSDILKIMLNEFVVSSTELTPWPKCGNRKKKNFNELETVSKCVF